MSMMAGGGSQGDGGQEREIQFSPDDVDTLLRTLADLYDREDRAMTLLQLIRFPRGLIPDWRESGGALSFWSRIFEDLDRGVMAGPYRRLLLAALGTYQTNRALQDLHIRYADAPQPTNAQQQPAVHEPPAGDGPAQAPQAGEARPQPPTETCRLVVWVDAKERDALESWLAEQGLEPRTAWLTPTSASYLVNATDPRALDRRMRGRPDLNWTIVAPGDPDYVIRYLSVQGPDGRSFRFNDVPSATPVGSVAGELVDQYTDGMPGGDQPTVVEHVGPDGPRRMNPDSTLGAEGVTEGARLRVGFERRAAAVNPLDRRDALFRVRNQLIEYEETRRGFALTPNSPALPTEYDIEFTRASFGPPGGPDEEPPDITVHQLSIVLGPEFPITAPRVRWLTDVFHPNVWPTYESEALRERPYARGLVCLGTLSESYQPSLDFGELCATLEDIAGYRNYSVFVPAGATDEATGQQLLKGDYYDRQAAEWAVSERGQQRIRGIGGAPVFKALTGHSSRFGFEIDVDVAADANAGPGVSGPAE